MKRTPLKRKTPLRKTSKRRQQEYKEYMRKREKFLAMHPICQVWMLQNGLDDRCALRVADAEYVNAPRSTEIHHKNGRNSKNYLDESTWMAVCHEAHVRIHAHPSWAREMGYLGKK